MVTREVLSDGYYDIPPGKIASIVTTLEMRDKPNQPEVPRAIQGTEVVKISNPDLKWYQKIFRELGAEWLWFSRLKISDHALKEMISNPQIEIYTLKVNDEEAGLLELDFRVEGECELSFLGIKSKFIGQGLGQYLMNEALRLAWQKPIFRFWVHTCTLDGPSALSFYQKAGFKAIKRQVEVADDPRLDGTYPHQVAPQVPII